MFDGIPTRNEENTPADSRKRNLIAAIAIVGVLVVVGIWSTLSPKTVPWKVEDGKLQLHATLQWNDDYPVCDLDSAHAEIVDLTRHPGWRPAKKIWGLNGSYTAGDFYVQNGKEAEVYLVRETRAVLLPRSGAIPVLVGASDPEALIQALRRACPQTSVSGGTSR